jgi:hypothetical protein
VPYTTNVAGTTITASWGNANVRDQVVTPFASASARTSAITSPVQGMISFRTDENVAEAYDGSNWLPVGWKPIATTTLGSSAASVTFSSIPATYKHLMLQWFARTDGAVTQADMNLRFNNDSGSNYFWSSWVVNNGDTSVSASTGQSQTSMQVARITGASWGVSTVAGTGILFIPGYSSTTWLSKNVYALSGAMDFGIASQARVRIGSWGVNGGSPAAVTRIDLLPSTGSFVTSCSFQLYGFGV